MGSKGDLRLVHRAASRLQGGRGVEDFHSSSDHVFCLIISLSSSLLPRRASYACMAVAPRYSRNEVEEPVPGAANFKRPAALSETQISVPSGDLVNRLL